MPGQFISRRKKELQRVFFQVMKHWEIIIGPGGIMRCLLMFGGIPWQVYFQRVLSSKDETTAVRLSIIAGFICLIAAIPAVLIGIVGSVADWEVMGLPEPENAASILPHVIRYLTNPVVATVGLGAVASAVMSSVDSSILSASSMASWNVYRPLIKPNISSENLAKVIKRSIWIIGIAATLLALKIESVYQLWILCSDFVYCLLFPALVCALFDKKANVWGAIAGFTAAFILRFGGGEATLGIPTRINYPWTVGEEVFFPFRTFAMVVGLLTIVVVSRLTQKIAPPKVLKKNACGMKKLLVTGISSFLGKELALNGQNDWKITGLYHKNRVTFPNIDCQQCDINDAEKLKTNFQKCPT